MNKHMKVLNKRFNEMFALAETGHDLFEKAGIQQLTRVLPITTETEVAENNDYLNGSLGKVCGRKDRKIFESLCELEYDMASYIVGMEYPNLLVNNRLGYGPSDGTPLVISGLPSIIIELVAIATYGLRGSSKWHNKGRIGLFLHTLKVLTDVQKTPGFKSLCYRDKLMYSITGLLHDCESKFIDRYNVNAINDIVYHLRTEGFTEMEITKFLRLRTDAAHLLKDLPTLINKAFRLGYSERYLSKYGFNHHGFVDGNNFIEKRILTTSMYKTAIMLMEISRCDSYDAGESTGYAGQSYWCPIIGGIIQRLHKDVTSEERGQLLSASMYSELMKYNTDMVLNK